MNAAVGVRRFNVTNDLAELSWRYLLWAFAVQLSMAIILDHFWQGFGILPSYQLNIKKSWGGVTTCEGGMNKEQLQNTNRQLILYFCIFILRVWAKTKTIAVCIGMSSYKYVINIASCNNNVVSLTMISSPSNIEATNQNYFPRIAVILCMTV